MCKFASGILGLMLAATTVFSRQEPAKPAVPEGPGAAVAGAQATEVKVPEEAMKMVNPVKPTTEGLAHAKKVFGYNCAMCHGKTGDGQGDLAADMKLKLKDWRERASLKDMPDGELFYIINKGKGQMPAGEQQMKPDEIWTMVHYVRSFADKMPPAKPR